MTAAFLSGEITMNSQTRIRRLGLITCLLIAASCARLDHVGKEPSFTAQTESLERIAMAAPLVPVEAGPVDIFDNASLWRAGQNSLLGDRRAAKRGDIMTVVIEIDEGAEFENSSERSRSAGQDLSIPQLVGIPQRLNDRLPEGASFDEAVSVTSSSDSAGDGSISRSEELTLRVAATIINVLPNGVLEIQGVQEVRVNFELRALYISGFVRPQDISRQNEITYDKIASAKISYGGRGQITDVQQPRYGQQVADMLLPF